MAADPRFFATAGPHSLAVIAAACGGAYEGDPSRLFTGVAPLSSAAPEEVSFLDNRRHLEALKASRAGAILVTQALASRVPESCLAIITAQPVLAFARVAALFHPVPRARPGVHPTAVIGDAAEIGEGCEIGAGAVIGEGARLGPGCIIGPLAVIGPGTVLGAGCRIHAHASISFTIAGDRVVLHPGARVGNEGFGFATDPATGEHVTVPQVGRVLLGDGVEVGANSTIDRGSNGDTVIGPGCRIDNLVQVGHNCRLGRGCVLVALAGLAGSSTLGDFVVVAAQAGVAGHITIGDKARVGAQSGVMQDVPAGMDMLGSPAQPSREKWRQVAALRRVAEAAIAEDHKRAGKARHDAVQGGATGERD